MPSMMSTGDPALAVSMAPASHTTGLLECKPSCAGLVYLLQVSVISARSQAPAILSVHML